MTQMARSRTSPDRRYLGVVYGIDILDHETGQVVRDDYVGKTRQRGRARENQHRDDQPWSDLIVGGSHVLWEGICTEDELDEMERHFIQDVGVRPRMNWKLNEDNPRHIPKWVQLEQRHRRDDAAGRPRWVPADRRQPASLLDQPMTARPARLSDPAHAIDPRSWKPWQQRIALWSTGWIGSTSVTWAQLVRNGWLSSTRALPFALIACLVVLICSHVLTPPRRRRLWKLLRRFARWLRR